MSRETLRLFAPSATVVGGAHGALIVFAASGHCQSVSVHVGGEDACRWIVAPETLDQRHRERIRFFACCCRG